MEPEKKSGRSEFRKEPGRMGDAGKIAMCRARRRSKKSVVRVNDSFYEDKRPRAINAERWTGVVADR